MTKKELHRRVSPRCSRAVPRHRRRDRGRVAADLDISHGSLTTWLKNAEIPIRRHGTSGAPRPCSSQTPEQEAVRLRAEIAHLRAEKTKLETERDILRSAAKYFTGETNW